MKPTLEVAAAYVGPRVTIEFNPEPPKVVPAPNQSKGKKVSK